MNANSTPPDSESRGPELTDSILPATDDAVRGRAAPTRDRSTRAAFNRIVMIVALGVAMLMSLPGVALGASAVSLTFHSFPTSTIGQDIFIGAHIKTSGGVAATGLRVILLMNGAISTAHADANGEMTFHIPKTSTTKAGVFPVRAEFDGTRALAPARATASLTIRPAAVMISTVPPVPGVPITLGSAKATTGADGTATLAVSQTGPQPLEALIDQVANPAVRVSFIRWADSVYTEKRSVNVRGDANLVLGLRTAYRASVRFIDENGSAVDPKLISRARFTSSTGQELVLTDFTGSAWWESASAVSRTGGLQGTTTLWRLAEVVMAGTNVVNQGQQAFTPTVDGAWTINLLLFDLVVRTSDAVTGGSLSGTAELVFPDATSKVLPFADDGTATFQGLPRGSYTVRLKTDGIAPPTPVALSRTQGATIRVISYFDIAAGVILALSLLVILLYIGRRRHIRGLAWAAAAPGRIIHSRFLRRGPTAVRRQIPVARSTMSATMSDVARVGRGPGVEAVGFARDVVTGTGRAIGRGAVSAARRLASVVRGGPRRTSRVRDAGGPSWRVPEPRSDVVRALPPPVMTRPVPSAVDTVRRVPAVTGASWFEAPGDDDEPTHECSRCSRPVPDSARFCRSCGHRQF